MVAQAWMIRVCGVKFRRETLTQYKTVQSSQGGGVLGGDTIAVLYGGTCVPSLSPFILKVVDSAYSM